jgi:hypothetical protein
VSRLRTPRRAESTSHKTDVPRGHHSSSGRSQSPSRFAFHGGRYSRCFLGTTPLSLVSTHLKLPSVARGSPTRAEAGDRGTDTFRAIRLPGLAHQAAGPSVFWSSSLVIHEGDEGGETAGRVSPVLLGQTSPYRLVMRSGSARNRTAVRKTSSVFVYVRSPRSGARTLGGDGFPSRVHHPLKYGAARGEPRCRPVVGLRPGQYLTGI